MAKRIGLNVLSLLLIVSVLFGLAIPAQPVQAGTETYNHIIPFTVTDNSGYARTNIPVIISFDVDGKLVVYGLTNATCTDTYVDSSGASNSPVGSGTAYEYMLSTGNLTAFIPSLPAYGSVTLNLYTGYDPVQTSFPLITGEDGYVTVDDDPSIELGDNFTITQSGWIDTDNGDNKRLAHKPGAFRTTIANDEEITSIIQGDEWVSVAGQLDGETEIYSLAVLNDKLYGGTYDDGRLYEWNGTNAWVMVADKLGAETGIRSLAVLNDKLYGGTSATTGELYEWNGTNAWVSVAGQLGGESEIRALVVLNGKLYGGTRSTQGALYEWDGDDEWVEVAGTLGAETTIYSLVVFNGKIYGGTYDDGRLYEWNGTNAWVMVADKLGAETGIHSLVVFNSKLYGGTGDTTGELYEWNGVDEWVSVAGQLGGETRIYSLAVFNDRLYGGTYDDGRLYEWNGTNAWVMVADKLGAETGIRSLVVLNDKLYGGTSATTGELYEWNSISVSATDVESGEHAVKTSGSPAFLGLGIDIDEDTGYPPISDNLVFNAPFWSPYLEDSPFESVDANAHTCTVTDATWDSATGRTFNGTSAYIHFPHSSSVNLTAELTIEAWIKPASGDTGTADIVTKGLAYIYRTYPDGVDERKLAFYDGAGLNYSTDLLTFDVFQHAVVTYDNGAIHFYINAVDDGLVAGASPLNTNTSEMRIGTYNKSDYFEGSMGEVRIYNKALTPDEVKINFDATKWKYLGDHTDDDFDFVYSGTSVPNTSANWTFCQSNVMPYMEYQTISVNGTQALWFEPNALISSNTLPDRQGDNDGTITWGTNSDITITGKDIMDSRSATSVGVTSAMMQGNLFDIGTYASVYLAFQYGLDTNYGYTTTEQSAASEQTLSVTLTGLTPNTTYHFRAIARSGVVYSYGEDTTFTTAYSTASQGSTTPLIISAGVFSSYVDTGDWLFCMEVVVTYPPYYPTGIPPQYFQVQLLGTDGTTILGASPLRQWGDRPASIYLAPTANVTNMFSYIIRITNVSSENITVNTTHTLESSEWYGDNMGNLDDWCRGAAWSMQSTDGTLLTDPYLRSVTDYGLIITDAASGYFTTGIPNIAQVRPNLFSTAEHKLALTTRSGDVDYNVGTTLTDRVGGTIVADATTVGDVLNLSGQQFLFYMILATILGCIVYTVSNTQGFGALGALCLSVPIVGASVYFNIMEISLLVIVIIIFVFLFVRQFIWKTM